MLPGFRFLFGAIVLSVSLLIFGLGATALLRVAHQEFTSLPSRPAPPPPVFAQSDPAMPSLAMLRDNILISDNQAVEETPPIDGQAAAQPVEPSMTTPAAILPTEPEKIATPVVAAPARDGSSRPEMPDTQTLASEPTAPVEPTAAAEAPSSIETKSAASISTTLTAAGPTPTAPEQSHRGVRSDSISTKVATIGGPAAEIETKASPIRMRSKSRAVAIKKRVLKQRTAAKHRIAKRARVVRRASQAPVAADLFGAQPFIGLPRAQ
jgi:hypothetical protein